MKSAAALIVLAALGLGACNGPIGGAESTAARGRYVGVGIYGPGAAWTHMAAEREQDAAAAKQADDQVIIVVTDSQTGEIRACGDMTGFCIGMNPWRTPMATGQIAPIRLTAHSAGDDTVIEARPSAKPPSASSSH
jgi:hypothetical protein